MSSPVLSSLGRALRGSWRLLDAGRRALLNLLLLALIVAGVWAAFKAGPPSIKPRTALVLDLAGPVVEQRAGGLRDSALKHLSDGSEGAARLRDVIAVLGKGHERTQEVEDVAHPFDDRVELASALAARYRARAQAIVDVGRRYALGDLSRPGPDYGDDDLAAISAWFRSECR